MERSPRGLHLLDYSEKRKDPVLIEDLEITYVGLGTDERTITAENIGSTAKRLADSINSFQPDFIYASDRGARLIALATHLMYQKLYGALPTHDRRINFRKISRKDDRELLKTIIKNDVYAMLETVSEPKLIILDDWVASGRTRTAIDEILQEVSGGRLTVQHELMWKPKAPVTISSTSIMYCDWYDRVDLIGVEYDPETLLPIRVVSPAAQEYRRKISESVAKFIKESKLES